MFSFESQRHFVGHQGLSFLIVAFCPEKYHRRGLIRQSSSKSASSGRNTSKVKKSRRHSSKTLIMACLHMPGQ